MDWNVLGARVSGTARGARYLASRGHTTEAATVGYRWEAIAKADRDILPLGGPHVYAAASARLVTAEGSPTLPRTRVQSSFLSEKSHLIGLAVVAEEGTSEAVIFAVPKWSSRR